VTPFPQVVPARQTHRNKRPSLTPAEASHKSMALLTQSGTGHCPNMPGLADQIDDGPVVFPPLKMGNVQFCRLFPAQPAIQQDPEQRSISLTLERIRVGHLPERSCLFGSEPVAETNAEVLRPFDPPDTSSQIQAEQSGISSFVCEAPDCREPAR
jgi:hypothetical protein